MNDFFKNWNPLHLFMVFICILAIVTMAASSNINGAIWAFNTLIWVGIAKMSNDTADKWRNSYDEVSRELREVERELNEYKNNETSK